LEQIRKEELARFIKNANQLEADCAEEIEQVDMMQKILNADPCSSL
jgi:hypothetical protein